MRLCDSWKAHFRWKGGGGLSIARTACWWIFWLTVSPASLLLAPHRPCLLLPINLSYCSRRLWGCQGQVWRGRRWEGGRGWERREAGLTGPRWPASTPVLLPSPAHLHRQNGFSRHSASLFSSPSSSIYTHAASIHFQYYFCFPSPASSLLSPFFFLRISPTFTYSLFFLTFCFLFIVNCTFFLFHFTIPPDLPSPPISLALGVLNCAFYLHAALQYSGGVEAYFHRTFTSETVPSPPTISIHLFTHLNFLLLCLFLTNPISSLSLPFSSLAPFISPQARA